MLFRKVKILLEVLQDVLELGKIFRGGLDEGFVRFQHRLGLRRAVRGDRHIVQGADTGFAALDCAHIDGKKLVETEIAQEIVVALVEIDDMQMTLPEFAETQGDAREGAHERGIHYGTVSQIDHEFAMTAIDHFLGEILYSRTIQKRPFSLDPNPHDFIGHADQN